MTRWGLLAHAWVMASTGIPKLAHEFLRERIHAIEQLEVLALVHVERAQWWDARQVAAALKIEETFASEALEHLLAQTILTVQHGSPRQFRYAARDALLDEAVRATLDSYANARLEVLKLVSRFAMDRIRTAHVRAFASAFLIRKPDRKD